MIEKICEIIDNEYCCDIDITVEEWKQLLINPKVFDDKSKEAIRKWYIEPGYSASCSYIGKKYNEHSMSANGIINGLAGRAQKELGRFVVKGIGNIAKGTRFIVVMKSKQVDKKPKTWEWTLREELIKAIEKLKIFSEDSYSDDELISDITNSDISTNDSCFEYGGKPKGKRELVYVQNKYLYPRSRNISINALKHANYKCEFDTNHLTFTRRNSDLNYTEPHHLVPISYHSSFAVSLDVKENIVSLCCNCHKQIHMGKGFEIILEKLYNERKNLLKMVGIDISLDELIMLYKNIKSDN
ncbi:HNH endonuclease [Clostridium intestinale]|uniref:5-methylcytosine-specific restriction enzyme A n=1 Tax=Clostridium intestinale DSM 6191 TaxID=1121320 RepID=A0A1M5T1E1_9CLOT|nr:HNH endonuclease [Clostridium intestinale]SHH44624.1 5-methylcytosine-specific restriction enzyme A [Clostridium intestinale DSM 6191]